MSTKVCNARSGGALLSYLLILTAILIGASPDAHSVSVTISKRALTLTPAQPHGQVQLISGDQPLEYRVTYVGSSDGDPEDEAMLLWSPRRLIVPPRASTPVRFSYRGDARDLKSKKTAEFRISVAPAQNTGPLDYDSAAQPTERQRADTTTARVDLVPSLIFKVHISPE